MGLYKSIKTESRLIVVRDLERAGGGLLMGMEFLWG